MKYEVNANGTGYVFTRDNGEQIEFTPLEINFVFHAMERGYWRSNIENAIELYCECLDFDEIYEDEFIQYCLDELNSKWECGTLESDPDFEKLVIDLAHENGIWRNN